MLNAAPVADAGRPYEIYEGDSLTLDASRTTYAGGEALSFSWDLNGDGDYSDASGATPTLSWAQLNALGIDDGLNYFTVAVIADAGLMGEASVGGQKFDYEAK